MWPVTVESDTDGSVGSVSHHGVVEPVGFVYGRTLVLGATVPLVDRGVGCVVVVVVVVMASVVVVSTRPPRGRGVGLGGRVGIVRPVGIGAVDVVVCTHVVVIIGAVVVVVVADDGAPGAALSPSCTALANLFATPTGMLMGMSACPTRAMLFASSTMSWPVKHARSAQYFKQMC